MLAVERQLAAAEPDGRADLRPGPSAGPSPTGDDNFAAPQPDQASFHAKKKSGTLKKYYKKLMKPLTGGGKPREGSIAAAAGAPGTDSSDPASPACQSPQPPPPPPAAAAAAAASSAVSSSHLDFSYEPPAGQAASSGSRGAAAAPPDHAHALDDDADSEAGRRGTAGSRMSLRSYDPVSRQTSIQGGGGSQYGTGGSGSMYGTGGHGDHGAAGNMGSLKNYFTINKKKKKQQYELDAIRCAVVRWGWGGGAGPASSQRGASAFVGACGVRGKTWRPSHPRGRARGRQQEAHGPLTCVRAGWRWRCCRSAARQRSRP
jgi:hypothetical protein